MKDAIVEQRPEVLSILLNSVRHRYHTSGVRHIELSVSVSDLLNQVTRRCLVDFVYAKGDGHDATSSSDGSGEERHGDRITKLECSGSGSRFTVEPWQSALAHPSPLPLPSWQLPNLGRPDYQLTGSVLVSDKMMMNGLLVKAVVFALNDANVEAASRFLSLADLKESKYRQHLKAGLDKISDKLWGQVLPFLDRSVIRRRRKGRGSAPLSRQRSRRVDSADDEGDAGPGFSEGNDATADKKRTRSFDAANHDERRVRPKGAGNTPETLATSMQQPLFDPALMSSSSLSSLQLPSKNTALPPVPASAATPQAAHYIPPPLRRLMPAAEAQAPMVAAASLRQSQPSLPVLPQSRSPHMRAALTADAAAPIAVGSPAASIAAVAATTSMPEACVSSLRGLPAGVRTSRSPSGPLQQRSSTTSLKVPAASPVIRMQDASSLLPLRAQCNPAPSTELCGLSQLPSNAAAPAAKAADSVSTAPATSVAASMSLARRPAQPAIATTQQGWMAPNQRLLPSTIHEVHKPISLADRDAQSSSLSAHHDTTDSVDTDSSVAKFDPPTMAVCRRPKKWLPFWRQHSEYHESEKTQSCFFLAAFNRNGVHLPPSSDFTAAFAMMDGRVEREQLEANVLRSLRALKFSEKVVDPADAYKRLGEYAQQCSDDNVLSALAVGFCDDRVLELLYPNVIGEENLQQTTRATRFAVVWTSRCDIRFLVVRP